MNTQERIEKMLKKTEPILQVGRELKPKKLKPCPFCGADENNGVQVFEVRYYGSYCDYIFHRLRSDNNGY